MLTPLLNSQLQQMYASCKKKQKQKKNVRFCCNTLPCVILLAFLSPYPTFCAIACFYPPSRSARKRMSVIMRTPSGKVRLYCKGAVSVYLHGNAHDSPSPSVAQNTSVESSPPLVASRSCQEIFTAGGSIKPRLTHGCQKN